MELDSEIRIDGRTTIVTVCMCTVALVLNVCALLVLLKQRPWTSMEILLTHAFGSNVFHLTSFSLSMILFPVKKNAYMYIASFFFLNLRLMALIHIGVQRFIVVYFPLQVKQWITKTRTQIQMVVSYGVVSVIFVTFTLVGTLHTQKALKGMILMLMLECGVVVLMYACIFIKYILILAARKRNSSNMNNRNKQYSSLKPMVISVSITLSFLVSNLPIILKSYGIFKGNNPVWFIPIIWTETIVNCLTYIVTTKYTVLKACFQQSDTQVN